MDEIRNTDTAALDGGEGTVAALEALLGSGDRGQRTENRVTEQGGAEGNERDAAGDQSGETGQGEGPATGDESEGASEDEDGGDPDAVIAPPRSWPAEMRAQFAELPPDLQRVIADRETERDAAFNRQVNEAAERRRAAEAELQAAATERRHYLASLSAVIGELAQQAAGEFADVRTTADLERLAAEDPQRFLRWQARREALTAAQAEQQGLIERERAEQDQRYQGYLGEQRRLLLEKIPDFADPAKGRALQSEATGYLRSIGFTDQEIGAVADHRLALVIRDAVAHRRSQTAAKTAAEKKVASAPRLQRPGARSDGKAESAAGERAAMTRIARHGTTDQQAAALTRLLEQES
jgi:hypothetical protein